MPCNDLLHFAHHLFWNIDLGRVGAEKTMKGMIATCTQNYCKWKHTVDSVQTDDNKIVQSMKFYLYSAKSHPQCLVQLGENQLNPTIVETKFQTLMTFLIIVVKDGKRNDSLIDASWFGRVLKDGSQNICNCTIFTFSKHWPWSLKKQHWNNKEAPSFPEWVGLVVGMMG